MKLVDTSSWVEYLRETSSGPATRVEELVLKGEATWCDMTLVELWNGARGVREQRELTQMEKEITLLPVNTGVWQAARRLARRCRDSGLTVPTADLVIAACAVEHRIALEHCDEHFDSIMPLAEKL